MAIVDIINDNNANIVLVRGGDAILYFIATISISATKSYGI